MLVRKCRRVVAQSVSDFPMRNLTRGPWQSISIKVLHFLHKNIEKQGIQMDCAEMGRLPKQDEVNLGSETRSWSLMQNRAACQPRRLSWYLYTRMQGIHMWELLSTAPGLPPCSSLHFASSTDIKSSLSFQKEDKHGFQCRLKYTRTFETWSVITNSWLLSSKWGKTFPFVGLTTKPRGKKNQWLLLYTKTA